MYKKPLVKICGIRDVETAQACVGLGADLIGIVFHPASKRHIGNLKIARDIAFAVQDAGGIPVGVFVDQDSTSIFEIASYIGIYTIQLHGSCVRRTHHDLPAYYQRIYVRHVSSDGVVKGDLDGGQQYCDPKRDYILFDGIEPGSGRSFATQNIRDSQFPIGIAGGLNVNNVSKVIEDLHPDLIDLSSGIESEIGSKDLGKIQHFLGVVHHAR